RRFGRSRYTANAAPARLHANVEIVPTRTWPDRVGHPTARGDRLCDRHVLNKAPSTKLPSILRSALPGGLPGTSRDRGVRRTLHRPLVGKPVTHGLPEGSVEFGTTRSHPGRHTRIVLLALVGIDVHAADHVAGRRIEHGVGKAGS